MKYLVAIALVAGTVAGFSGAANAAGGCGPGFHRGAYGACRPNYGPPPRVYGPRVVVPPHRFCPRGFVWRFGRCRPI
ncbi:GCG_CRPN prefix-to-repeats domain-containing protein [Bradyrhizobium sp. STM 3562]|uniref:GCG_CRPN prefix-to-repeats domain-containing protein n=1 Tax=Bradyrhizobium sp. STM 3562 TaxID=578924 RepID=UPI003890F846